MNDSSKKRVNRREFLRAVAAAGAALMLPAVAGSAPRKDKRPNIIFFLTDDQDKHSLGAYGGNSYTPNLDRMAREGMVFNQAYVSSTVCTPSRYSFLTGRYAGRSYSRRYEDECPRRMQGFPSFNMELEEDNMNVGAVLQKSGYATQIPRRSRRQTPRRVRETGPQVRPEGCAGKRRDDRRFSAQRALVSTLSQGKGILVGQACLLGQSASSLQPPQSRMDYRCGAGIHRRA